jgi:hypothetical protein
MADPKRTGQFGKGNPGKPKGAVSKTTKALKEAILEAAEKSGRDLKGKDGLVGYLQRVADEDVKAFSGLLGKVLPLQVTGDPENPLQFTVIERRIVKAGN